SGIANVQTSFALRFLLLTFLGHELGHIAFSSSPMKKHLTPSEDHGAMNCYARSPEAQMSEEQFADDYGMKTACEALRRRPDLSLLPTSTGYVLTLLSRLEHELDTNYFATDDTCVGDKDYPSIARRKHTFAQRYLRCLYPSTFNPVAEEADRDA